MEELVLMSSVSMLSLMPLLTELLSSQLYTEEKKARFLGHLQTDKCDTKTQPRLFVPEKLFIVFVFIQHLYMTDLFLQNKV